MKFKPTEDRVLVSPHAIDAEVSGFFEASKATERPKTGAIVAIGPGRDLLYEGHFILTPMPVSIGQTIFFPRNVGTEIVVEGEVFLIMRLGEAHGTM